MQTNEKLATAALQRSGYRMTTPRRRVARYIAETEGSFRAESIADALPGVGRATVYRTLKLLTDAEVLCKTAMPDGSPLYSFDSSGHHHHLICTSCGSVSEFHNRALERSLNRLGKDVPGLVHGHRVELFVTCLSCLDYEFEGVDRTAVLDAR